MDIFLSEFFFFFLKVLKNDPFSHLSQRNYHFSHV